MTKEEIEHMIQDLKKREEETDGSHAWMWFGLTEKLMMSDATKRKAIENLSFVECSELLLLWNRRESEIAKQQKKEREQQNKNKLKSF